MPRQQEKRQAEQSQPSQTTRALPLTAIKFTKSSSPSGRLAFADITINKQTFPLFDGLKICSFVILKAKGYGLPRRVYVPGHKLPGGQNFRHLQEESGDLEDLRQALNDAYDLRYGTAATTDASAGDEDHFDEEHVDESEIPR
jgi:hypothetical protein